jgi:uncharacterized protein (TIRG00374 family)
MISEPSKLSSRADLTGRRSFLQAMLKSKKVRGILQLLVSLALLVWLVNRVGLDSIISILADIDWRWYLFAFLLSFFNILLRSYRWYILLNALDDRPPRSGGGRYGTPPFRQLLYLYFVGFFFNNFIPSGFGGDVVKVLSLRQEHGRGAEALSSVIMDRLTGLIGSSLIALIALTWNSVQGQVAADLSLPPALTASIALISLGVPLGFILVRWVDPVGLLASRLPSVQRLIANARLQRLLETIHCYPLPTLLKALLTSIPFTLSLVVTQYSIARALSVDAPFYLFPLFVPIISIINLLPLSFNGLGMREGVYQFLFVPMGVSSASAMAMSLAFYFLRVGIGLFGGLLYAFKSISGLIQTARTNQMEL